MRWKTQSTRKWLIAAVWTAEILAVASSVKASDSPFSRPHFAGQVDITELIQGCRAPKCLVDVSILATGDFVGDSHPDLVLGAIVMNREYRELDKPGPIILVEGNGKTFRSVPFASGPVM